jgi:hypothetical protein
MIRIFAVGYITVTILAAVLWMIVLARIMIGGGGDGNGTPR